MSFDPQQRLASLVGHWQGTCRTWFEPDQLADESPVASVFQTIPEGPFIRHRYAAALQGRPRTGEETLVYDQTAKELELCWFDSFHMNYGLLYSTGPATERGFSVFGRYAVGGEHPPWGWRTTWEWNDDQSLAIIAYNVSPDGESAKAIETILRRVGS